MLIKKAAIARRNRCAFSFNHGQIRDIEQPKQLTLKGFQKTIHFLSLTPKVPLYMPRPKKQSAALTKAEMRLSGMKSIDNNLDFGNRLSNSHFSAQTQSVRDKLDYYNTLLSKMSEAQSELAAAEKALSTLSENMLLSVAIRYGKNSTEYEMAGGIRRDNRRRTNKKQSPKPQLTAAAG
jgi:hypothetical protein